MSKNVVVFILLSLAITLSVPAFGQKEEAKDLFDKGVAALEKRNFRSALNAFEQAYAISPHWAVLAHIGTCYANLNQPIKAIRALEQYLENGGNNIPEDEKATAREIISQQRRKVGVLVLSVKKEGVKAMVDGEPIGTSPFDEQLLLPGTHEVAVVFAEDDIVKRSFNIGESQAYLLRIEQEQHLSTMAPPPSSVPVQPETEATEDTTTSTFGSQSLAENDETSSSTSSFYAAFGVAIGFTVIGAAAAGVGWGFFAHYSLSESNFAEYLTTLQSTNSQFEDFTWKETCSTHEQTEKTAVHYCNTEMSRREFADSADVWRIVGITGSGVMVVGGTLAIVFYALRDRFGNREDKWTSKFHIMPHLTSQSGGLNLSFNF